MGPSCFASGGTSYSWSGPNGYSASGASPAPFSASTNGAGTYIYTVTVTDANGCTGTASDTVSIWGISVHGTATPDTIQAGQTSELIVSTNNTSNLIYIWNPNSDLIVTDSTAISSAVSTTSYTVIVEDTVHGCVDSTIITLVVIEPGLLAMPNAFSPNGDLMNDTYFPVFFSPQLVIQDFRVYDRWGQLVYDNPTAGWDGTYKGEPQPSGAYLYFVSAEAQDPQHPGQPISVKKEGPFTLMR